jgi:sulfate transport system ATP-binding protein
MSIQLKTLNKRYHQQKVVDGVSLDIESGELLVLLGASGSGKSTILRMIAGLTSMDGGEVWLHGQNVSQLPPQQRQTGFVFQNYSLFQHMTVEGNIAFGLKIQGLPKAQRQARVAEMLSLIGLEGYEKRLPSQLSGGQQQRVALARALAPQPKVLLLDEPFGALDAKIRVQLRRNLRDIQQKLGLTAILVTHDQEEAFDLADRIGILEGGKLLEVGRPSQLYRRPQHPYTASFLGLANILPARRNSHYVRLGNLQLPAPQGTEHLENQAVRLMFRPEDVILGANGQAAHLGPARIEKRSFAGSYERLSLRLPDHGLIEAQVMATADWQVGQELEVGLREYHLLGI